MTAVRPLLSLHAASVRFGAVTALHPLDLQLQRGERLALVGANGSGKTTLLRLLDGVLPASSGQRIAHVLDGVLDGVGDGVGDGPGDGPGHTPRMPISTLLFQRPFLLHLSARRNVALGLWLRGVPAPQRRARSDEALRRVGLHALAQRPARTLSGGQQQRLALARAWALAPDILYLDEPTASLDPSAKREVEGLIADFCHDGMTMVMSTHNLGQAKRLCQRVVYLEAGRVQVDLPTELFFDPAASHPAAAFLKGELPWA